MLKDKSQFLFGKFNETEFRFFDEEMRKHEACLFNDNGTLAMFLFRNSEEEFQAFFAHHFSGHTFSQKLTFEQAERLADDEQLRLTFCERPADFLDLDQA